MEQDVNNWTFYVLYDDGQGGSELAVPPGVPGVYLERLGDTIQVGLGHDKFVLIPLSRVYHIMAIEN